jgi:hypothetical protein
MDRIPWSEKSIPFRSLVDNPAIQKPALGKLNFSRIIFMFILFVKYKLVVKRLLLERKSMENLLWHHLVKYRGIDLMLWKKKLFYQANIQVFDFLNRNFRIIWGDFRCLESDIQSDIEKRRSYSSFNYERS